MDSKFTGIGTQLTCAGPGDLKLKVGNRITPPFYALRMLGRKWMTAVLQGEGERPTLHDSGARWHHHQCLQRQPELRKGKPSAGPGRPSPGPPALWPPPPSSPSHERPSFNLTLMFHRRMEEDFSQQAGDRQWLSAAFPTLGERALESKV